MELTYFKNGHWRLNFDGRQYNARFVDRLAAYENTGLMPGEVAELQALLQGCESKKSAEWVRLQELAEADKDGRVMVLPVKPVLGPVVSSMLYIIEDGEVYEDWLHEVVVGMSESGYTNAIFFTGQNQMSFSQSDIGKTVFLTREEAEAKLREV